MAWWPSPAGMTSLRSAGPAARLPRLFDDPYAHAFVEAGRALSPELADSGQDPNPHREKIPQDTGI
ncbi:MAG: hypothetical protein ACRDQU_14245 [Pseudonocardiaceae bacterium]